MREKGVGAANAAVLAVIVLGVLGSIFRDLGTILEKGLRYGLPAALAFGVAWFLCLYPVIFGGRILGIAAFWWLVAAFARLLWDNLVLGAVAGSIASVALLVLGASVVTTLEQRIPRFRPLAKWLKTAAHDIGGRPN